MIPRLFFLAVPLLALLRVSIFPETWLADRAGARFESVLVRYAFVVPIIASPSVVRSMLFGRPHGSRRPKFHFWKGKT
jgi:hypothetical protein